MRNIILLFFLIVGWTTTVYAQNEQETIEVTGIVTDPKNEFLYCRYLRYRTYLYQDRRQGRQAD